MTDAHFDDKAEAMRVENLAQQFHDAIVGHNSYPIESRNLLNKVTQEFGSEMSELWKDPAKMRMVALELEKINNSADPRLSVLPKATIRVSTSGDITELSFPPVDDGGVRLRLISTPAKPYTVR